MKPLLILVLPLALAACTPAPHDASPPRVAPTPVGDTAATPARGLAGTLAAHHWHLDAATSADGRRMEPLFANPDKPLQLDFADGRVAVGNTCNRMGGEAALAGARLAIGQLISTQMACADAALMAMERAAGTRLAGDHAVTLVAGDPPRLELVNAAGDTLAFIGTATAQTRFGMAPERVFLEVAAERVDCHHPVMPDSRCLQVRELQYDAAGLRTGAGAWGPLYQEIEGYDHRAGTRTVVRLDRYQRRDVPADASAVAYVLDMVVESELVPAD
ncbi:META and DUF4377 domain-containing protein [Luteimonas sp. MC1782]|uniref:META and DUF4377 domain-containing protein n=1 Tax=Luteimonas sp. MC1782 TaxID=2760305 RepID=UPI0016048B2A|nr:META and DUF4377 domain-containing protein [Luteimonas sp. MC1782]MBB1473186.1 META and DUF4377 domain-containing protein [Luteimonas sp. MC1782]